MCGVLIERAGGGRKAGEGGAALFGGGAEPAQQDRLDKLQLIGSQNSETTKKVSRWQRLNALHEKGPRAEETRRDGNLKLRVARRGRVRDDADDGAISVRERDTED